MRNGDEAGEADYRFKRRAAADGYKTQGRVDEINDSSSQSDVLLSKKCHPFLPFGHRLATVSLPFRHRFSSVSLPFRYLSFTVHPKTKTIKKIPFSLPFYYRMTTVLHVQMTASPPFHYRFYRVELVLKR